MRPFVYQGHALDALAAARKRGQKRALVVMATGLGKTVVCGFDLERLLVEDPGRVLFLSHDMRINAQARKTFEKMLGKKYSHGNFNGKEKHLHRVDFLYATLQTMANHRESFDPREFKYIVLDEAHHGEAATFKPTLEYFLPAFFLAVTATPERGDEKDITEFFGEPVYKLGVFEALAKKYLCHVDYRLMTDEIQNLEVLDTPTGKLSIAELNRTVFIPKRDKEIARLIAKKTKNIKSPRVMIFCASIEHVERMAALMPHAAVLHSDLKDKNEVKRRLDAFRTGEIDTVLTVDMLNEGIDVPEANVLVFLRSTSSRTIFLQQLGRGLRKMLGKANVLVLDFVANCERIEMVDWLVEGVKHEAGRMIRDRLEFDEIGGDGGSIEDVIDLHLEGAEFDERLFKLVEVVHEVRGGYTEEALIQQLSGLAKALGRFPTQGDVNDGSKRGKCASVPTFTGAFGSWNAALEAAGMTPITKQNAREVLAQQLKDLAEKLGHTPNSTDLKQANKRGECASYGMFNKTFGSWNMALEAAGLEPTRNVEYSQEDLKLQAKSLAEKLGRVPTMADVRAATKRGECVPLNSFKVVFGSWNAALEAAGMTPNKSSYTKDDLLQQLKDLAADLGRAPTLGDINDASKRGEGASGPTFTGTFGGFSAALRAAGMAPNKNQYTDGELLQQLRDLAERLGRIPIRKDADQASSRGECASVSTFLRTFGSWKAAVDAAGLPQSRQSKKRR